MAGGLTGDYYLGKCTSQNAFCNFLLPNNGTKLIDQGLVNVYQGLNYDMTSKVNQNIKFNQSRVSMLDDMVIVHLRILKPDVQLIDAKYSINDKFANFGGNFGTVL